ncbi:MAG: lipopolysaccharide assembly protein LapB [Hydrogenophilales bacterium CG_4_9_14_3_um_filter_63_34]|nr:MAG: lipopolysaccharide assembly protein LapB [Hydrogenophilales bacterium CG_4_10_14_3_um_filter_63_21]PJB02602.1 MAG: lipopolysaccharide assembly protein LapB [Hydrogenophilales bacterium CG_4_9_14_3_um_filter_63_34]
MELEAWHLLVIPLFFALGWLAARVDIRHVMQESRAVPRSYFKGLNYLLNEQPDQAIEAFLEVTRLDPDTLELHFALGALFRRRGELDRAIRIHQSLVDRADLPQDQRMKALYGLGEDFLKAGLLDRAEDVFRRLETGVHTLDALRNLLEIQVLTKDWQQAIVTAERLEKLGCVSQNANTAHYHCELAAADMRRGDSDGARAQLEQALRENRRSARACLLLGDLEAQAAHDEAAIAAWRRIEEINPAFLPLAAERLVQAYGRLGQDEQAVRLLRDYLEQHPSPDLLHLLFQTVAARQGWEAARELAGEELKRNPGLRALDDYLQASNALQPETEAGRVESRLAQDLVHTQVSQAAYYQCGDCGFKARQFFWQCPACARWESISPQRLDHE